MDTDGAPINLERASSLFDGEAIKGEYSYPFTWPLTERNRRILGNPQESSLPDEPLTYKVQYMSLGELVDGLLYIDDVAWDESNQTGTISGNLVGTEGILANALSNKRMKDFRYSDPIPLLEDPGNNILCRSNACYTATAVTRGLVTGYPFCFPVIKWDNFLPKVFPIPTINGCINYWIDHEGAGNTTIASSNHPYFVNGQNNSPFAGTGYMMNRIVPIFYLKWIMEKLLLEVGFSLQGDILNDDGFKKLILVNNKCINQWVTGDTTIYPIIMNDKATEILPADHVPDMTAREFINEILNWFGLEYIIKGNIITLITRPAILALDDQPLVYDKAPVLHKYLSDEFPNGISISYTTDDPAFGKLVPGEPDKRLYQSTVDTYADLPTDVGTGGMAWPADSIALVVETQTFYQNKEGTWKVLGQNLINNTQNNGKEVKINGAPVPITEILAKEQRASATDPDPTYKLVVPYIDGQGTVKGDSYINWDYVPDSTQGITFYSPIDDVVWGQPLFLAEQTFTSMVNLNFNLGDFENTFGLRLLFYHGIQLNEAGDMNYPFASSFQKAPDTARTNLGEWDLSLFGARSVFDRFWAEWSEIIKKFIKYEVTLYPELSELHQLNLYQPKTILQQRAILYKLTYNEPYDGAVKVQLYKIRN